MNINGANVQIMWKEIAVIFLAVYVIRLVIDIYIKTIYNKISNQFYSHTWNGLEEKIRKHRKICNVFSNGPWNKSVCLMYNGLCMAHASIALINNDDVEFVNQLGNVKNEDDFEMKPFVLALYYCSKHDEIASKKYYNKYLKCNQKNENIKVIMEYLFLEGNNTQSSEDINNVIKTFKNPAIIKLLRDNNIIG